MWHSTHQSPSPAGEPQDNGLASPLSLLADPVGRRHR
jgi:hypothetical protein